MSPDLPIIIEPEALYALLGNEQLLLVDLGKPETHAEAHLPGAMAMEYSALLRGDRPAPGHLPEPVAFSQTLSAAGITPAHTVVAYDDEGGGKACRLVWNLHAAGHPRAAVLNGGIHAWQALKLPLEASSSPPTARHYGAIEYGTAPVATRDEILARLGDPGLALLDARTPEEFAGTKVRAAKGGHIPGAVNLNWLDCIDRGNHGRLYPDAILHALLGERGITADREVFTYCHTHHRSAHSYVMLRHLGFEAVKGYPGSWSEWGNDPQTPVES